MITFAWITVVKYDRNDRNILSDSIFLVSTLCIYNYYSESINVD